MGRAHKNSEDSTALDLPVGFNFQDPNPLCVVLGTKKSKTAMTTTQSSGKISVSED
jgi:hypothetical protein